MRGNTQNKANAGTGRTGSGRTGSPSRSSRLANTLGAANSAESTTGITANNTAGSSANYAGNNRDIFDTFMKPFTANKYGQERHARSLDPMRLFQGYSFVGPGTELNLRSNLEDSTPLNSLDRAAKAHDYAYNKEAQEYSVDRNKNKHMENIWKADSSFIASTFLNRDDPVMGTIAAGMIGMKMLGEKAGLLDTKRFSGIQEQPRQLSAQRSVSSLNNNGGIGRGSIGRGRQRTSPLMSSPVRPKGGALFRSKENNLWDKY